MMMMMIYGWEESTVPFQSKHRVGRGLGRNQGVRCKVGVTVDLPLMMVLVVSREAAQLLVSFENALACCANQTDDGEGKREAAALFVSHLYTFCRSGFCPLPSLSFPLTAPTHPPTRYSHQPTKRSHPSFTSLVPHPYPYAYAANSNHFT